MDCANNQQVESVRGCMAIRHLLIAGLISVATAAAGQTRPHCPQAISFGLYENGYIYDKASKQGIDQDVANELASRSGCQFEFKLMPRARIWHELKSGTLMMTGSGIQTELRDGFSWSVRYMAQKNFVLILTDLPARTPAQFMANRDWIWGAVRSYKHGVGADAFLDELRKANRVSDEADLEAAFRVLALQRASALFAPPPAYAKYVKQMKLGDSLRVEDWFPEDPPIPHAMFFSKTHFAPAEMAKWATLVRQLRTDGTLKAIYTKHLGGDDAERMLQFTPD